MSAPKECSWGLRGRGALSHRLWNIRFLQVKVTETSIPIH